ncbi:MAG: ABC transporter permease [Candidatus Aminicenantes bacterium]|nr:MAG: ABC transporter permease [Candidatus Aminicenantes bacterium]
MFNMNEALNKWRKSLRQNQGLEDGYIAELHSHLLDEIESLIAAGRSEQEAFETAVARLGPIDEIGTEYLKTNSRRLIFTPPGGEKGNFLALMSHYFTVSLRRIKRHKGYSLINILGLAIGLAATILILQWVQHQLSYDRFHEHTDRLYVATFSNGSTVTPTALAEFMKTEYPEVVSASRFGNIGDHLLKYGKVELKVEDGIIVEPDFLKMFTFHFLRGDANRALNEPHSIVISRDVARLFFGDRDPIDKIVTFSANLDLKVTGVFENYPANSHFQCRYILPLSLAIKQGWVRNPRTWDWNDIRTYVQLGKGVPVEGINRKISNLVERHRPQDQRPLFLQPVTRLHLNPFNSRSGTLTYVYVFSAMAFFILLIACINFMNLTTARSTTMAREVGIRKTMGARRSQLIRQFLGESLLLTVISLGVGLGLAFLFLPLFNSLTAQAFTWKNFFQGHMITGIFGLLLLTGLLAGSYPALFLSHFQPVRVLKGTVTAGLKGGTFRKILVVTQFSLSMLLILATVMIHRQVHYLRERDVGFDRENIVYFGIGERFRKNVDTIKAEWLSNPDIERITLTDVAPYRWMSNAGVGDVHWEGKENQQVKMVMVAVDTDYLETFGMKMARGRFFSKRFASDVSEAFVVNETAVKAMEMTDPIGKTLKVWDLKGRIIGVVQDYHFQSLHRDIIPMAMRIRPDFYSQACVRFQPRNIPATLRFLEDKWKKVYPEYPFEYHFLDDRLRDLYRSETAIGRIVRTFTLLGIFISCLGLFGLSAFMAEQRTKEIGIRKTCGASVTGLVFLLSKDFLKLVLFACVLATPVAAYLIHRWLAEFACRVSLNPGVIIMSSLFSLAVAFLTVSYQTLKTARSNPSETLRYE